jgi:uncharacterized membrane protein
MDTKSRFSLPASQAAHTGMIAAVYAALTVLCLTVLQGLAWGPVQLRLSEVVCVLPLFTRAAVPGLTIGCVIANVIGIALTGSGALGLLDVVFGSLGTLLGALWMRKFRNRTGVALLGPVLANALIIPTYLPIILMAFGFYTIPFVNISIENSWLLMYLFGFMAIGLGEAIVIYALGLPLLRALRATKLFEQHTT